MSSTLPGALGASRDRVARTAGRLAAVGAVVALVAYGLLNHAQRHGFFDLEIYRGAARWWLDGHALYTFVQPHSGGYGFTYPPFAALCMVPTAFLGFDAAAAITSLASAAAITLTTWWLLAPVARRHGWPRWFAVALAVPVVSALEPVRETVGFGQVNLFLVALVLADVAALRRGRPWAGIGIGLATAVKLTPGLFVLYLLVTRRWRAAGVAAGAFGAATLLAAMVDGGTSWQFWTQTLWHTDRVGKLDYVSNQSLLGLLARLADSGEPDRLVWLTLCLGLLALLLSRAVRAFRAGDDLVGFTLTGLGTCVLSPISWTHHLYWVVPAVVVLVDVAAGRRLHRDAPPWLRARPAPVAWFAGGTAAAIVAMFALSVIWPFNRPAGEHYSAGPIGVLAANAYVLTMLALLVLLPIRAPHPTPAARRSSALAGAGAAH
ncbi:MAG: Alpha,2-mannosyltransferase [Cryptosporangiaceae bacterium]|jgi:alpha-1,2-mannosyltransferase|nr:Alpha,2-mannosyltransferase [Cryptosporangiaceae bacterium]